MTLHDRDDIASPPPPTAPMPEAARHSIPPRGEARPRPSTPTERGDGDYGGSASSLARQNAPREAKGGQDGETVLPAQKPDRVTLKGVKG